MMVRALSGLALLILVASPLGAAPLIGIGDPDTAPALAGGAVIDFDAGPTGQFGTLTFGNVTITGINAPFTIGPDFIGQFNNRGVNSLFNDFDLIPDAFRVDFATPVNAFGFNWGAADNGWTLQAFDSDGNLLETLVIPPVLGSNAGEFFGIDQDGIAFATLTDNNDNIPEGDFVFVDNFTSVAGVPSTPTPAPAGLVLLGVGLAGLGLVRGLRARAGR